MCKKKAEGRAGDTSTAELQEVIALVEDDADTSVLTMGDTDLAEEELFSPHDIDIRGTQEVMIGGAARDPLGDFCTLVDHVVRMRRVYSSKIEPMCEDDLAREAKSEGFLQQVRESSKNY